MAHVVDLREAFDDFLADKQYQGVSPRMRKVFLTRSGALMSVDAGCQQVSAIVKLTGASVRKAGPHTFMPALAVEFIRAGGDAGLRAAHKRFAPGDAWLTRGGPRGPCGHRGLVKRSRSSVRTRRRSRVPRRRLLGPPLCGRRTGRGGAHDRRVRSGSSSGRPGGASRRPCSAPCGDEVVKVDRVDA